MPKTVKQVAETIVGQTPTPTPTPKSKRASKPKTLKKEEKEVIKTELLQVERKFKSAQFDVREFFQSKYETDSDEIVVEVDDVNELLRQIGSEELTKSWSATITITATVTGIEAPNKEAAMELVENNIDVSYTDDGDLWVDDISVESVYPEA